MIWIMISLSYVTDWKDLSLSVGRGGGGEAWVGRVLLGNRQG